MKIENVSGIPFEDDISKQYVYQLRHTIYTPVDFNQKLLTDFYGNLLEKESLSVLEIGCGWGRNAQYFRNKNNIKYFSFDPSEVSLKYFRELNLPSDRFYVSNSIDETILSQKYDLIFSTYVLQHIGYPGNGRHSVDDIFKILLPLLKDKSFMFFHELHQGQNTWDPAVFAQFLRNNNIEVNLKGALLEGCHTDEHILITCKN